MTAEVAVAMPVLILLTGALAWVVSLGVAQVRTVDAAREVARAVARGDDVASSENLGHRVAPDGASFSVSTENGVVTVAVSAPVSGPGGVFRFLPSFTVHSTAVAGAEP